MKHLSSHPKISILLPVYNAEKYLPECLDSILGQTFYDFEIIAINDASTDNSLLILEKYAVKDTRIKIFSNNSNKKLATTLNKGIELATAPLIARMDADDISYPNRLEYQYNFMKTHPEVSVCGTAAKILGTDDIWSVPETDDMIRSTLVFNSPILHPTVIYRTAVIRNHSGYDTNTVYAQDYELWHRLSQDKSIIFANINIPLLYYRLTASEKSFNYKYTQEKTADTIREKQLHLLNIYPTPEQLSLHNNISSYKKFNTLKEIINVYLWLKQLSANEQSSHGIRYLCWQRWRHICRSSSCKISYLLYLLLPSSKQRFKIIKNFIFKHMNIENRIKKHDLSQ